MFFGREPFLGFIPSFVVWNLIIIGLVAIIFWLLIRGSGKSKKPLTILKERYAEGEIDGETFHKMKGELSD
ncbi:MAG: SHOCT domain-containing protein [Candidatus Altiarchaeales archaeon]|nr:SHOCT domain-containing protein [Candidatus Altiarchaeales archaeon]